MPASILGAILAAALAGCGVRAQSDVDMESSDKMRQEMSRDFGARLATLEPKDLARALKSLRPLVTKRYAADIKRYVDHPDPEVALAAREALAASESPSADNPNGQVR